MSDATLTPAEAQELAGLDGTTYEVPARLLSLRAGPSEFFFARSAAEASADTRTGQYIEWTGRSGALVTTPQYQADCETWMEAG